MDDKMETLSCGCRIGVVSESFVIEACDRGLDCPHVKMVMAEAERQAKPTTVLDMP